LRFESRVGTPGSACERGKYFCCSSNRSLFNCSSLIGSWAKSWKILPA
jgi:hypothetical protein